MNKPLKRAPPSKYIWFMFVFTSILVLGVSYQSLVAIDNADMASIDLTRILTVDNPLVLIYSIMSLVLFGASYATPTLLSKNTKFSQQEFTLLVIRLVFIETGIMFGFVLTQATSDFSVGLPFYILGWILFLLAFPGGGLSKPKPRETGTLS